MVGKVSGTSSLRDPINSATRARVEAKTGGPNAGTDALHVIAEMDNYEQLADEINNGGNGTGAPGIPVFNGAKYRTAWSRVDITPIDTGTGTQIFEFTGKGRLEHFLLHLEDKNTDILLFIDSVEVLDVDCRVFEDMDFEYKDLGETPFHYDKGEKVFKFYPRFPLYFETSFEVKARSSGKKVKEYVVSYTDES